MARRELRVATLAAVLCLSAFFGTLDGVFAAAEDAAADEAGAGDAKAGGDAEAKEAAGDAKVAGVDDKDDLDLDDLDDNGDTSVEEPVEDFDLTLPPEDQKKRMRACMTHTMNHARARREQLDEVATQMAKGAGGAQKGMSKDQAINTLIFSWMMSCYMNIDSSTMQQATLGSILDEETETQLFAQRTDRAQQVHQASQRQWKLLESVLMEQSETQKKEAKEAQQQQQQRQEQSGNLPPTGQPAPLGSSMSGSSQALYVFCVFGVIFGLGAIGVFRLSSSETSDKDRSAKNLKKQQKAEAKLNKKKL